MPKLKTNRAAAKRFRKTANGFKSGSVAAAATTSATSLARASASCVGGSTLVAQERCRPRSTSCCPTHEARTNHGTS